jgi:pimeloyl-ACP methyl ester carboxylesterase
LNLDVNLDTHIDDVANLIKWNALGDVILVGHSYGGMVISGVAEKAEKAIGTFVMLDAFYPENSESLVDQTNQMTRDGIAAARAEGVFALAPRSAALFMVNENDVAWVDSQCTPHPIATMTDKLALTGARERIAKRAYIRAATYPNVQFDAAKAKASRNGFRIYNVDCGHDVMIDKPERLAEILEELT